MSPVLAAEAAHEATAGFPILTSLIVLPAVGALLVALARKKAINRTAPAEMPRA
ncbi:MAG TPA: hypothetical protein VE395_08175 [Acidimicrobiales bacterium]|nr:hypothetical protein [Acidimicrobiales bacterium]